MASGAQVVGTNLSRDEQLRGRQNVRHALRALNNEIEVFHNPKISFETVDDVYDRPLDVVLVHKTKGILGLAIKSGEIVEETGGLVSQYQPHKQFYKIIDPVKKAQKALQALMEECDPGIRDYVALSVGVVFPDTHWTEFTEHKAVYLFKENLSSEALQREVEELFIENWDVNKAQRYADNYPRIVEFLKTHSDNNIQRVERKETLSKLGIREEKKAFQVPQSSMKKAHEVRRTGAVRAQAAVAAAPVSELRANQNRRIAAPPKIVRTNQDDVAPVITKKRIVTEQEEAQRKRLVDFFNQIDESIKMQQSVELSGAQWGLAIACAAILICLAYFIGRNAGIVMHMH